MTMSQTRQRIGILLKCAKGPRDVQNAALAAEKNATTCEWRMWGRNKWSGKENLKKGMEVGEERKRKREKRKRMQTYWRRHDEVLFKIKTSNIDNVSCQRSISGFVRRWSSPPEQISGRDPTRTSFKYVHYRCQVPSLQIPNVLKKQIDTSTGTPWA